jgi:uncharacterized repeat protein (TIGR04076 family)
LAVGSIVGPALGVGAVAQAARKKKRRRPRMKLVITVEKVKGRCPVYKAGDKIVLDSGYRFNLKETTAACMHSLASILPYHVAISKGVPPNRMGLAHKAKKDGKAYVQCLDPCDETGGGTAIFSIERVEED